MKYILQLLGGVIKMETAVNRLVDIALSWGFSQSKWKIQGKPQATKNKSRGKHRQQRTPTHSSFRIRTHTQKGAAFTCLFSAIKQKFFWHEPRVCEVECVGPYKRQYKHQRRATDAASCEWMC